MESYTIICKNRSFGRIVRFSKESIDDAQKVSNLLMTTVGTWGRMVPITKEKFYAKFFNNGALTAGHDVFNNTITGVIDDPTTNVIYDSQPFFDTAHASKVGGSYANYTETRALTHANLQTTWLTYTTTNNRDERGEIVEIMPNVLMIPPALRFTAQVILNTTNIPGSMDNDTNVMNSIVQPMEWAYLSDADGWFLGRLKGGLMATDREDPTLDFWQDRFWSHLLVTVTENLSNCWNVFKSFYHNTIGNNKCEGSKNEGIRQSAAKYLNLKKDTVKVQRPSCTFKRVETGDISRDDDMVCTSWRHGAALTSGIKLAT